MKNSKVLTGIILSVIGILFIILKGEIISIAATFIGVVFIINGIMTIINKDLTKGVITIVIGAAIILFGWLFITIALYIVGALLIAYGILDLINKMKLKVKFHDSFKMILYYLIPTLYILSGAILLFNQGDAINFVFIFSGVILLVNGILVVMDGVNDNKQ